jgi:hypothetical protein
MITTRTYLKGCDWCNATGFARNSNPSFSGNTSLTELCPVCNGNKTITVTEVAEMPTEEDTKEFASKMHDCMSNEIMQTVAEMPTEEEARKQAELKFMDEIHQAIWISGCEWFRNRMSKPNNSEQQLWRDIQEREREGFCSPAHSSPKNIDSSKTPENI